MISNQLIVDVIERIHEISGTDIRVFLMDGTVVSHEGPKRNLAIRSLIDKLNTTEDEEVLEDQLYLKVYDGTRLELIISCENTDQAHLSAKFARAQFEEMFTNHQEKFDRDNFIKNLLLDNLLLVDIYNRAKQIHINPRAMRVAYIVETEHGSDTGTLELIRALFADHAGDFVTAVDENDIVVVKELNGNETDEDLKKTAKTIVDMLNSEAMKRARVAYGRPVEEIRKVSNSYKEAKLALSVGAIFNSDLKVVSYASLGIGRLIYQLPVPMCKMFIGEIFKEQSPEEFDEETLVTINEFFENNLNVSETARQLYIHRNTLVYRLDKIQRNTGLDLRIFDDAITFKIALMVVQYMNYMESQE